MRLWRRRSLYYYKRWPDSTPVSAQLNCERFICACFICFTRTFLIITCIQMCLQPINNRWIEPSIFSFSIICFMQMYFTKSVATYFNAQAWSQYEQFMLFPRYKMVWLYNFSSKWNNLPWNNFLFLVTSLKISVTQ